MIPGNRYEVHIDRMFYADALGVYLIDRQGGKVAIAEPLGPLVFKPHAELSPMPAPTLSLPGLGGKDILKAFVTAAVAVGIKPEPHAFLEGRLAASEAHLADMRRLVFKGKP